MPKRQTIMDMHAYTEVALADLAEIQKSIDVSSGPAKVGFEKHFDVSKLSYWKAMTSMYMAEDTEAAEALRQVHIVLCCTR